MSTSNREPAGSNEFGNIAEQEKRQRIADALGASTVYPLTRPLTILDIVAGNVPIDWDSPTIVKGTTAEELA